MVEVVQAQGALEMSQAEERILEASVAARRIYKYTDQNGVVYYSFTRQVAMTGPPVRSTLSSRLGVHLTNFLSALKRKVEKEENSAG